MQKIKITGKHYSEIKMEKHYILLIKEKGSQFPPKNLINTSEELIFAVMINEKQYSKIKSKEEIFVFEGELVKQKLHEEADFSFVCYHINFLNKETTI